MARKFDQHKIRELVAALRYRAEKEDEARRLANVRLMTAAAQLIEDMSVVVYGIQEKLGLLVEDTETGENL